MSSTRLPAAGIAAPAMHPACRPVRLVGRSSSFTSIRAVADTVAKRHCTVMILGETGTGKEMIARYIHTRSDRANKPFIPVDCSAISDTLFESQMFGHVAGAFTGAVRESLGFIRAAHGGTLFLDEIGELPLLLQAKLLRVLQERCVVPVGEAHPQPVDIRLVVATHRDLAAMVRAGTFRQDLYYRLNIITTTLPPLRERTDDIVALAEHFLSVQADLYDEPIRQLSDEAVSILQAYSWPGNIRELANAMESAHILAQSEVILPQDLPVRVQREAPTDSYSDLCLAEVERRTIAEALRRSNSCKTAAGRLLGINIQRLNRRIEKLNIRLD